MEENKKPKVSIIGGVPLTDWKRAFAYGAALSIDKDYFSDILEEMYPGYFEDEETCDKAWENTKLAFKEIFEDDYYNFL